MERYYFILTILVLTIAFTGCDPYYSITITNASTDTAFIFIKENYRFHTEKVAFSKTKDGLNLYQLLPNEEINIGSAIAEIDNDIPCDKIRIVTKRDSTLANGLAEIKSLFDKNYFGKLKKPYNITID